MGNIVVKVQDLGKKYQIRHGARESYQTFRETVSNSVRSFLHPFKAARAASEDFWAVKDVSFEIKRGECVGIIGRNGAGKSTLLKLLSRITEPTTGRIELHGRVGSLLEVGTGFHPELTGRENIYLNGTILGMRKKEITRKFDEIVAFSEVEKFLDTPVKRYSSGMYVRLAFAVAAHLEPEILVVDEVLAVGDMAFQKKCLGKMGEVAKGGRTVIFVSHNMGAISDLCSRGILLERGRRVLDGEVAAAIELYSQGANKGGAQTKFETMPEAPCCITQLSLQNAEGRDMSGFDINQEVIIKITYEIKERVHGFQISLTLLRNLNDIMESFDTDAFAEIPIRNPGVYEAYFRVPAMFLKAGLYTVDIMTGTAQVLMQNLRSVLKFEVEEFSQNTVMKGYRKERRGHIVAPCAWATRFIGERG